MNEQTSAVGLDVAVEPLDDIPLLLGIIEEMGIRKLIDGCVKADRHWQGVSIGTVISMWLCYLLSAQDHRLVAVREWVWARRELFNRALGIQIRETECSDDRLASILSLLGQAQTQLRLDEALMGRWLTVYALPRDTIRLDGSLVSVYHQREEEEDTLLRFGFNRVQREGVRQFKVMLATLDPLGMPLTAKVVSGEQGDDLLYIPAFERVVSLLGKRDFLVVGDSKMSGLANRAQLVQAGSCYLCPMNENTFVAEERLAYLNDILAQPQAWQEVHRLDEHGQDIELLAVVIERTRTQAWVANNGQAVSWSERLVFVRSVELRESRLRRLARHWRSAQAQLDKLSLPPGNGRHRYPSFEALHKKVESILKETSLSGLVQVELTQQPLAGGRSRWVVERYWRDETLWRAHTERLGWRTYATNMTVAQMEAPALVGVYRHQVLHERTFSRLKTRRLNIQPVFLRDEQRIVGLTWLLELALRVLTLSEFRLRQALAHSASQLTGLNRAAPSQATVRPTMDRVLAAFQGIHLTVIRMTGRTLCHITPLTPTQRQILALLDLPVDLYDRLVWSPP